ncbi:cystatin domain-containing protein [Flammeovirga aprica]|uniref:2-oxoglutarate dehydrogenase n=1 Tax=Flammeovirga aprica JL-4 TaxID=694437 RepID=A0A7X9RZC5_9BACT|nr:cystatin domain-containing protein [Flammeovirga aprica]NME71582.1 2-oxoglutarate dehydrogenase [Flammeovirga aprica JL-4]
MNSNILFISILSVFLFASCQNSKKDTSQKQSEQLAGGWAESEITPEVKEAVNFVLAEMNTSSPLKKIESAQLQVVAGINYKVIFSLKDNTVWKAKVYRDLEGNYTISDGPTQKSN